MTTQEKIPLKAENGKIPLVHKYRRAKVVLEPAHDIYDQRGSLRVAEKAKILRFENSACQAPADWQEMIENHPSYQVDFWAVGDPTANTQRQTLEIVDGAMSTSGMKGKVPEPGGPPIPDWDEKGAAELRAIIRTGEIDILEATVWEMTNRNRGQVVSALQKAQKDFAGLAIGPEDEPDDDEVE